jgi:hypothetical protein
MMGGSMTDDTQRAVSFMPLRPGSRRRTIVRAVIGPVLWLAALIVAAWLVARTDAIELGLLVATASFVVALLVLSLLRAARVREEQRHAERR